MDTTPVPKNTYSGKQCNEIARRAFYRAMELSLEEMEQPTLMNLEKLEAFSSVANAAGNDFEYEAGPS